jgi:putative endonuclease
MNHAVHGSAWNHTVQGCAILQEAQMSKFHYVYVLRSLHDGKFYVGSTTDLRQRLRLHNSGLITSTRARRPFELAFYEAYRNQTDAKRREEYFKTTKGKFALKVMLREYFRELEPLNLDEGKR